MNTVTSTPAGILMGTSAPTRVEGKENTEHTPDEVAEMFYENFSQMKKFKMELAEGGSLILGKRALQSAVLLFLP